MSRIGNKPVAVPSGVTVSESGGVLTVKGPKGQLTQSIVDGISFDIGDGTVKVNRADDRRQYRANHGLMRALLNNMVTGVSAGFERKLEIIGVGYKAAVQGNKAVFNLGYSHPVDFPFPDGVSISVDKNTLVTVSGISKEKVGQAAAEIRGFRPPDSYKGKGVRYQGEYVRLKAGKTA
ncbi:MAG: 50S ribosomal protein L6 [Deltaproteobacteria bacterium]|nr:50S ribosomal protein L6 [Deltaproteobacteria bacterium]